MLGRDFGYWNTFLFKYFSAFMLHNVNLCPSPLSPPPPPILNSSHQILSKYSIDSPLAQGECAVVLWSKSLKHFVIWSNCSWLSDRYSIQTWSCFKFIQPLSAARLMHSSPSLPLTLFSGARCLLHATLSRRAVLLMLSGKCTFISFFNSHIKQAGLAHRGAGLYVMSIQLGT